MNRMTDDFRRDSAKDPAQLEREIDATRSELLHTLEQLEQRLSPGDMLNTFMSRMRRDGGEFAGNLGNSVKDHPLPALLTGIGIAWMMASNGRHHEPRAESEGGHRLRESADRMRERWRGARESVRHGSESVRHGVQGTRSSMAGSAESVRRRARRMSSAARHGAGRARSGMDYLWHEQPLLLGAIGLAAGAIAGAALPPTEEEDRAFGELRDRTLDRARTAGAEGARQARERVESAAERTSEKIRGDGAPSKSRPEEHRVDTRPDMPETPTSTSSPETGLGY